MKLGRIGCVLALSLIAAIGMADAPIANLDSDGNTTATDSPLTLDQRVSQVENQLQYLISQQNQTKSLGAYITNLQGQIEQLNFQVTQMQKQLSSVQQNVVSLSARIKLDETKSDPASQATSQVPASKQEVAAFQNAYNLLIQHQYNQAIAAFNSFMVQFPKSSMAPDANYWLGELYLVQGQPDEASQHFQQVISNPNTDSDKASDAMLKLGMIYQAYGDSAHAKQMFQKVIKQYPNTQSAQAAQEQLNSMQ